jgi:hypothetical protein
MFRARAGGAQATAAGRSMARANGSREREKHTVNFPPGHRLGGAPRDGEFPCDARDFQARHSLSPGPKRGRTRGEAVIWGDHAAQHARIATVFRRSSAGAPQDIHSADFCAPVVGGCSRFAGRARNGPRRRGGDDGVKARCRAGWRS